MKTSVTSKNQKYTALAWVLALLVLAVAIPVNLIVDRLNINFDMTPNSIYSLTETTESYLTKLDEQGVVVDVYFLNELVKLESDSSVLDLYETLMKYDAHESFNLISFDPDTNPELGNRINPEGIYNLKKNDFFFVYGDNVKRVQSGMIYTQEITQASDGTETVSREEFRAEPLLTGAMMSVVEGIQATVYFLEGHGEHPMSDFSKLTRNLQNFNYGCQTLNLISAESVPEDCGALIVAGPTEDITDEELDKLNAYAKTGGSVMLLMTPNSAKMSYTNISTFMSSFCIAMDYDRVYESDSARYKSGDPYTFMCDLAPSSSETDDDLTGALINGENGGLLTFMPTSRTLSKVYGTNYGTCQIDTLITAQPTAVAEPYGGTVQDFEEVTGTELTLALYSKDTLRSDAKLMVFGTAEFLTDEASDSNSSLFIIPTYLFSAGITWMQSSEVDVNIANKERAYDTLQVGSNREGYVLIAIYIAFPILIAAIGVVVWLRRKDA